MTHEHALQAVTPRADSAPNEALAVQAADSDYVRVARLLFGALSIQEQEDLSLTTPVEYSFRGRSAVLIRHNKQTLAYLARPRPARAKAWRRQLKVFLPLADETLRWRREERRRQRFLQSEEAHRKQVATFYAASTNIRPAPDRGAPIILFALHWLDYGGAEKFAIQCVQAASRMGKCIVLTDKPSGNPLEEKIRGPNVELLHLPQHLPPRFYKRLLQRLFEHYNITLLHIHHCVWMYENLPTVKRLSPNTRVLDSLHIIERDKEGYPRVSGIYSNYIDAHHVISKELIAYYASKFERIEHVHLGRLIEKKNVPPQHCNLETRSSRPLHVTFVGRMEKQKRPQLFVLFAGALAQRLKQRGHQAPVRFSMIGEGSLLGMVKAVARLHAKDANIEFLSAKTDVEAHLSQSDILFLPSENEGVPLVVYEAITSGCLPITTDVGGNREACPQLLVAPHPREAIRRGVDLADELLRHAEFRARQWTALVRNFQQISEEPSGLDVCSQFYQLAYQ